MVDDWGPVDEARHLIRITTSWATTEDMVDALIDIL
jgi:hypothetical protein